VDYLSSPAILSPLRQLHENIAGANIKTLNPLSPGHFIIVRHPHTREAVFGEGTSHLPVVSQHVPDSRYSCYNVFKGVTKVQIYYTSQNGNLGIAKLKNLMATFHGCK
jgi:hypothetical protein